MAVHFMTKTLCKYLICERWPRTWTIHSIIERNGPRCELPILDSAPHIGFHFYVNGIIATSINYLNQSKWETHLIVIVLQVSYAVCRHVLLNHLHIPLQLTWSASALGRHGKTHLEMVRATYQSTMSWTTHLSLRTKSHSHPPSLPMGRSCSLMVWIHQAPPLPFDMSFLCDSLA